MLNEKLMLSFLPSHQAVKLVISEADVELVCRKETLKNLIQFLKADEMHIFKGRLQLHKQGKIIEVIMKNKSIAIVASSDFEKALGYPS